MDKRIRSSSSTSISPTTKRIRALPIEMIKTIESRLHPIDVKQLSKSHYELTKLKATLFRDFMSYLVSFSEANPGCSYTIKLINERPDSEDADFEIVYNPDQSSASSSRSRYNSNRFNIASITRKSPRLQRNAVNADISTRFDYIARTTKIVANIEHATDHQRRHLLNTLKDLKSKVFPNATFAGGKAEK